MIELPPGPVIRVEIAVSLIPDNPLLEPPADVALRSVMEALKQVPGFAGFNGWKAVLQ